MKPPGGNNRVSGCPNINTGTVVRRGRLVGEPCGIGIRKRNSSRNGGTGMMNCSNDHDAIVIERGPMHGLAGHEPYRRVICVGICEAKLIGEVATGVRIVVARRLRDERSLIVGWISIVVRVVRGCR